MESRRNGPQLSSRHDDDDDESTVSFSAWMRCFYDMRTQEIRYTLHNYTVYPKKTSAFYRSDIFVRFHPILDVQSRVVVRIEMDDVKDNTKIVCLH